MSDTFIKRHSRWIVVMFLTASAVFYYLFDPMEHGFMPQCVFYHVTGLRCAGCGSQRMLHALLQGDITGAFHANAVAMAGIPVILFLGWLEFRRTRYPALYRKVCSPVMIIAAGVILSLWMILRNVFGL